MGLYPNKNFLSEISLHFVRCLKMKRLAVEDVLNQLLRALSFKKKNRTKQFRVKDTLSFPHPVRSIPVTLFWGSKSSLLLNCNSFATSISVRSPSQYNKSCTDCFSL